jgi:hypothetical protein
MVRAVAAAAHGYRVRDRQARVVEHVGEGGHPSPEVYPAGLRYRVLKKGDGGLLGHHDVGHLRARRGRPDNIILLDARRGRWNFPELKEVAYEECQYWDPDMVIIEKKATGGPLMDELARGAFLYLVFAR